MKTTFDRVLLPAAVLFVAAIALRAGLVFETDDGVGLHSPLFKGDAPLWLEQAHALLSGRSHAGELGLPFRPPGTARMLAAVWDGTAAGLGAARTFWFALSALLAPLTFLLAIAHGRTVAWIAGGLVAVHGGAIQLGSTVTSEVPASVLSLLAMFAARALAERPSRFAAARLGVVLGLSCLLRAEQILLAVLLSSWVGIRTRQLHGRWFVRELGMLVVTGFLVMLPWQLEAHRRMVEFDTVIAPALPPRRLPWEQPALERLGAVPGFARASTQLFVEATLRHRGVRTVTLDGLRCVDDAFGCWPEALPTWPLVALYGPLNFALANHDGADGGFDRALLDRPPPLTGGTERFDPGWLASLPRDGDLALEYPPHVRIVRDGYGVGAQWLTSHPIDAVQLVARKLWITFSGIATGLGASQFPLGAGGTRRRVDLTVADGTLAIIWRVMVLGLCVAGVVRVRRQGSSVPVLLWITSGLVVAAAFFGYARLGAALVPPVAILIGLGLEACGRAVLFGALIVLLVGISLDVVRVFDPPRYFVDGVEVHRVEANPPLAHRVRTIEVR